MSMSKLPPVEHTELKTAEAPSHHDSSHRLYQDAIAGPKGHTPPHEQSNHELQLEKMRQEAGRGQPKEEDGIARMLHGFGIF